MRKKRRKAYWVVEKLDSSKSLHRLIGPLAQQTTRKRTMCVAIGSGKRLQLIADILNELEVEI